MKKSNFKNVAILIITLTFCFILLPFICFSQGIAININNLPADSSAIWDMQSTKKGFLIPRMTTTQRNNITSPAYALQIFNKTTKCLEIYLEGWYQVWCSDTSVTNCDSWVCGCPITDSRDSNVYATVSIGEQCWMAENLAYLPCVGANCAGSFLSYFVYGYNGADLVEAKATDSYINFGVLYNWRGTMDGADECNGTGEPPNDKCNIPVRGVCPEGWHIPSHYEWTTLEKNVGSNPDDFLYDESSYGFRGTDEGGNIKVAYICGMFPCWNDPNTGATNSSGFSGLPGGFRVSGAGYGSLMWSIGYWWSSSEGYDQYSVWFRKLTYNEARVERHGNFNKSSTSISVRCIKD